MHRTLKFLGLTLIVLCNQLASAADSDRERPVIFEAKFEQSATKSGMWSVVNRAGDYSNHELECYTPSNISLANSVLTITSHVQSVYCGDADHSKTLFNYTSAMIQWTSFSFTYGTVEIRAKTAGGQGSWPAIWLLGSNCQASNLLTSDNTGTCDWPNPGSEEIDILEIVNGNYTSVSHNLFNGGEYFCQQSVSDTSQNWHLYSMTWAAGLITFAVDGTPAACSFNTGIPSTPMFLIVNNAMGGDGGNVNNSNFPQTMLIDYVRVYAP